MSHISRQRSLYLVLLIFVLFIGQSSAQSSQPAGPVARSNLQSTKLVRAFEDDAVLASRAIKALRKLRADVIVYRSLDQFESDGRLAHVSFATFARKLDEVTAEIEPILSKLSDPKLRNHLTNSIQSYRDGAFWWSGLDQSKVVTVANLRKGFRTTTPAEAFLTATTLYTIAMNWRLADKYLMKSEKLITDRNSLGLRATSESVSISQSDGNN